MVGLDLRREPADARELRRLRPEERGQRHAVHVAADRGRRRVHVAVRVHPYEAQRLVLPADEVRRGGDRAGREAVIAAENDRNPALLQGGERGLVESLADLRDLTDVLLRGIAERLHFGDGRHQIALVYDGKPEGRETLGQPGDPES